MTDSTRDIDRIIRDALGTTDAEVRDRFTEQSLPEVAFAVLHGRHRLFMIVSVIVTLLLAVAGLYAALRFVQADDVRVMLLWGGGAALCFGAVAAIKIWYWLEMQQHVVVREIKRIELQLALLAQKLPGAR